MISLETRSFCVQCQKQHGLPMGHAYKYAEELQKQLETHQRIDFENEMANACFSTDYLFGVARGQMFGVLECEDEQGAIVILKAFSCQYNSKWLLDGWAPPLLDVEKYTELTRRADLEIKRLGRAIDEADLDEQVSLKQARKEISQKLMKKIHGLYELHNFRQQTSSLQEAFYLPKGMPTGTGDCCAPKLLNWAAQKNLRPIGLAEFYWGRENRSQTRKHGEFYSSCESRCQPILGFMLCGREEL